jgi:hypothetical protein
MPNGEDWNMNIIASIAPNFLHLFARAMNFQWNRIRLSEKPRLFVEPVLKKIMKSSISGQELSSPIGQPYSRQLHRVQLVSWE